MLCIQKWCLGAVARKLILTNSNAAGLFDLDDYILEGSYTVITPGSCVGIIVGEGVVMIPKMCSGIGRGKPDQAEKKVSPVTCLVYFFLHELKRIR